jgi:hypothetical protein
MAELTLKFKWIKIYYIASNNEMSQPLCSAKDVQVSIVTLTDLLPNL